MLYTGIDLHKRSVVIATVNERGEMVREEAVATHLLTPPADTTPHADHTADREGRRT